MILAGLFTKKLQQEADKLQADADETFGPESASVRIILGVAIGHLVEKGGIPATITYLTRSMALLRQVDDETPPAPTAPPAS